jgi:4-aminobutyrate aminotransferase-like enzyme
VRRDPEFFGDVEMDLVYIAKKLKEALRVEDLFTKAEIDYAVETDTYRGGLIFVGERVGAFFYVLPEQAANARDLLRKERMHPFEEG